MVPSSIQWTSTPSVHIIVYPISRYVISPAEKPPPPETTVRRRSVQSPQRRSSAGRTSGTVRGESRARRSLPDDFGSRRHRRSAQHRRRTRKSPSKRSPRRRRNGCTGSSASARCERRCGSRVVASGGFRSAIHRRAEKDRKRERYRDSVARSVEDDDDDEDELEVEVEVEDSDYDGDDDNDDKDDKDEDDADDDDDRHDGYDGDGCDEVRGGREDEQIRPDDVDGCCRGDGSSARVVSAVDDDSAKCGRRPRPPPVGETENRAMRCSANVVLLAHGNRSLYVLTIQRNQVTSVVASTSSSARHRNHRPSSTTVISYKLPGGQLFISTDDEQQNYQKDSRNTCTCPDDQRWYSAAIDHFMTQLTFREGPTTATTTGQAAGDDRPQFVPLGNWYRTQQDGGGGGGGGGGDSKAATSAADGPQQHDHHRWRSNSNYYPYKPAHVSHRLAGHKRVYAVPDACRLFPAGAPSPADQPDAFRLQTPRAKTAKAVTTTRTATAKTKTATTTTTTYKCKFVPLARLHENSRMYGPVLASLPAILSGMTLICSP